MKAIAAILLSLIALPAIADLPAGVWRRSRPIILGPATTERPVFLPLDDSALAEVKSLGEFRIAANGGQETAYRLVTEMGQVESTPLECRRVDEQEPETPIGWSEMVADLGLHPSVPIRLRIDMAGAEFRRRVAIDGSADRKKWEKLAETTVFRIRTGKERTDALLPSTSSRYLRIRLLPGDGRAPSLSSARAEAEVTIPEKLIPIVSHTRKEQRDGSRKTIITFDSGGQARAVALIRLVISEPSFDRVITVAAESTDGEWAVEGRDAIRRLALAAYTDVRVSLPAARRVRLTIDNGDDRPLTIQKASLHRYGTGLLFTQKPGQSYELWYGARHVPAPDYDLERMPLTVKPSLLVQASLGPPRALPRSWSERHPTLLWGAVILSLIVLLAIVIRNMGRFSVPDERRQQGGRQSLPS